MKAGYKVTHPVECSLKYIKMIKVFNWETINEVSHNQCAFFENWKCCNEQIGIWKIKPKQK